MMYLISIFILDYIWLLELAYKAISNNKIVVNISIFGTGCPLN